MDNDRFDTDNTQVQMVMVVKLQQLQREYQTAQQQNEALRRQKTVLEGELADLQQQNGEANETLQSWKSWKEDLQAALAG